MSVSIEAVMRGRFPEGSVNRQVAEDIVQAIREVIARHDDITNASVYATEQMREGQQRVFPSHYPYRAFGSAHEIVVSVHFQGD